jgi:hypothetical protein
VAEIAATTANTLCSGLLDHLGLALGILRDIERSFLSRGEHLTALKPKRAPYG